MAPTLWRGFGSSVFLGGWGGEKSDCCYSGPMSDALQSDSYLTLTLALTLNPDDVMILRT